ncbi:MAG: hypothetical protein NT069_15760 [Planctomycetota bacterium]|nr:hypothetical protein [Planctomycetota bacterium]
MQPAHAPSGNRSGPTIPGILVPPGGILIPIPGFSIPTHAHARTRYTMRCFDSLGNLKWEDGFWNRVMTSGLNKLLDATLKTGLTSPAWYVGLIGAIASDGAITSGAAVLTSASNPFTAADAGRSIIVRGAGASGADLSTTILTYTNAGSVTLAANAGTTVTGAKFAFDGRSASASGSVDNSASPAVFNINATTYIFGAFLADNSTKSGTTGTLYGTGINGSGIARAVANTDTLNVTVTPSITG